MFNMLFMLNIDGLIIIHINLNDQINKRVIYVVSCYSNTNWIVFEFVILKVSKYSIILVYLYARIKMSEISADISPIFRVSGATETIFDI